MRCGFCFVPLLLSLLLLNAITDAAQKKCQVCIEVINKLQEAVDANKGSDVVKTIDDTCSTFTGKQRKICSNVGALPNSPTRVVNEVARQLSISVPAEKICQNLAKNDPQICEIMHQFVPSHDADFKKMSVKELKQTLSFIGVECTGCMDKSDFIEMAEKNRDKIPRSDL
ncbi:Armet protein [Echinococcus multilocularis]|uniref:Mesencephalic astrocyte-derived neurotrophic factor homolog n=1 Tax=Echinococcus multilocularis TaxID=6211 RepID=A0A068XTL1_ECHMU|nr:Armet protein [Echinococcus multilocularis]